MQREVHSTKRLEGSQQKNPSSHVVEAHRTNTLIMLVHQPVLIPNSWIGEVRSTDVRKVRWSSQVAGVQKIMTSQPATQHSSNQA